MQQGRSVMWRLTGAAPVLALAGCPVDSCEPVRDAVALGVLSTCGRAEPVDPAARRRLHAARLPGSRAMPERLP